MNNISYRQKNKFYRALIVSEDLFSDAKEILTKFGIKIIDSAVNKNVNPFLSKHADMQIARINNNEFVCAPECYDYYSYYLKSCNVKLLCGKTYLSSNYPSDIAYNIVVSENYAIHKFNSTDAVLKDNLKNKDFIDVNQGYTSCNLCKLPFDSFITSDNGIWNSIKSCNLDVLKISEGNIDLPGFEYGFFGGATFMIGDNTLAVNGDIYTHPDAESIIKFCHKQNVEIISLSSNRITDIGSAIPII